MNTSETTPGAGQPLLRVALPNKGALSEKASRLLALAGYRQNRERRELVLLDPENRIEFFFLRPKDIATFVGEGNLDVGITGRDLYLDAHAPGERFRSEEIMQLGFGRASFRFAAPAGTYASAADLQGKRIATSFTNLLSSHLAHHGITAEPVRLEGAVESSIQLGVADAIADVVETGNTLRAAGMEVFGEPILTSEAIVIRRNGLEEHKQQAVERFVRRLQGVLTAEAYVMVDYDVHKRDLEATVAVAPGRESPTISETQNPDWAAVRVMVPSAQVNQTMDDLYEAGAKAIIVTRIHASRL